MCESPVWRAGALVTFIRYLEDLTAGFAMHGVGIVTLKSAPRTGEIDLSWSKNCLRQPHEKRNADKHGDNSGKLSGAAR